MVAKAQRERLLNSFDNVFATDVSRRRSVLCGGAVVDDLVVFPYYDYIDPSIIQRGNGVFDRADTFQYLVGHTDMAYDNGGGCWFVLAGMEVFGQNRRVYKK